MRHPQQCVKLKSFFFFLFFYFKLLYSCFTRLCQFLPYSKVNQPHVHLYSLPLGHPSSTLPTLHPSRSQSRELSSLHNTVGSNWLSLTLDSIYKAIPISQVIQTPAVPTHPLLTSSSLFQPCKQVHLYHFLDSTYMH